ncbi:PLP-dependent aminotransferase family protein [Kineococcus gynurae]|uniref:PLP-dependent aminotransferase family protein n=1 Tax=Kineococcus gynurae TaxID=452979 RepID=A0ABV5LUY1_9ACTN
MRPVVQWDLPVRLDRDGGPPLQQQLVAAVRAAVLDGRLAAGVRLPATRATARQLGVARATVLAAYEQLGGEGYLRSRAGSGTFVEPALRLPVPGPTRDPAPAPPRGGDGPARPPVAVAAGAPAPRDLTPGRPDTSRLLDPTWRRVWREAVADVTRSGATEPPPLGRADLRAEVADHLGAARGLAVDAADVVVTAGTVDGLALALHVLGIPGGRGTGGRVVVEDPGYPRARRCLHRLGCTPVPVDVDEHGLRVEDLPAEGVAAVLVTPSHQYPLGAVLPLERRTALLRWARRTGAVVLEDDYDGEFRYGAAPLPALAGLDRERTIHLGTFSKTLSPQLRAGYLVLPPGLRAEAAQVRHDLGEPVSAEQQRALAAYLASGALRRHVARARRDHGHRRTHLRRRLAGHPRIGLLPSDAGLHAVLALPAGSDVPAVLAEVRRRGYLLADLDDYTVAGVGRHGPAVVLGYGDAGLGELDGVVRALEAALLATGCVVDN